MNDKLKMDHMFSDNRVVFQFAGNLKNTVGKPLLKSQLVYISVLFPRSVISTIPLCEKPNTAAVTLK